MRITKKQLEEIDFLEKFYINSNKNLPEVVSSKEQREEYIKWSVLGKKAEQVGFGGFNNPLMNAKRSLDIDVKSWRHDISCGLMWVNEFIEDFNHPFATKLFNGILKGATLKYKETWTVPEFLLLNIERQKELNA